MAIAMLYEGTSGGEYVGQLLPPLYSPLGHAATGRLSIGGGKPSSWYNIALLDPVFVVKT